MQLHLRQLLEAEPSFSGQVRDKGSVEERPKLPVVIVVLDQHDCR